MSHSDATLVARPVQRMGLRRLDVRRGGRGSRALRSLTVFVPIATLLTLLLICFISQGLPGITDLPWAISLTAMMDGYAIGDVPKATRTLLRSSA